MPWSSQNGGGWKGGSGGPWGQGPSGGNQGPDLEQILKQGQDRLKKAMPGAAVAVLAAAYSHLSCSPCLPSSAGRASPRAFSQMSWA